VNDVGLHMYAMYMINKMALNCFIKNYIVLLWKWTIFGKVTF